METTPFPEIQALKAIYTKHQVSIKVADDDFLAGHQDHPAVDVSLEGQSFRLFVDDEYQDVQINNPILTFCLILRELEHYQEEEDYLKWCTTQFLEPANQQVRAYYMQLGKVYHAVEKIIGEIDSQISNYDFGLNAGAAQALRNPLK